MNSELTVRFTNRNKQEFGHVRALFVVCKVGDNKIPGVKYLHNEQADKKQGFLIFQLRRHTCHSDTSPSYRYSPGRHRLQIQSDVYRCIHLPLAILSGPFLECGQLTDAGNLCPLIGVNITPEGAPAHPQPLLPWKLGEQRARESKLIWDALMSGEYEGSLLYQILNMCLQFSHEAQEFDDLVIYSEIFWKISLKTIFQKVDNLKVCENANHKMPF